MDTSEQSTPPIRNTQSATARALDRLLVGTALLFACFVASFAVRNSDFWMHLASGRLLAAGQYHFGQDPFAYTTSGIYWANHAWLFDLTLYGIYETLGGPVLVALKALLVMALAWVLLRIRRPGGSLALPAACTVLALLVMSRRLLLQPTILSYLFLGLTLALLWQPYAGPGRPLGGNTNTFFPLRSSVLDPRSSTFRLALLLGLFVLWVNVDGWFWLGPTLVALFWLGERWGGPARHTPGWLVPAAFAVCLLNPHHVHAFTPPAELSPAVWFSGLPQDPRFRLLFLSPFQLRDYLQPTVGLSAAGLAYFALTALGLVSFALGRSGLRDWRLPVWAVFAVLAAFQARDIPFFAVVAGPIAALNLQDWWIRRADQLPHHSPRRSSILVWAQAGLLLVQLALVVLVWPGWLQAIPHDAHRVAWAVEPDPALQRNALALHRWRQDGLLAPGERLFATHPDVAHYWAWFCPGEKGFLDARLPLFTSVARPFEEVCRGVGLLPGEGRTTGTGWQGVLRDHRVGAVVLYGDEQHLAASQRRLDQDPANWALLRVDGRVLSFAWREGAGEGTWRLRFDAARVAYGTGEASEELPPAPERGPARPPQRAAWWAGFVEPAPTRAWEADAAAVYLRRFNNQEGLQQQQSRARYLGGYAAGLAGLPALASEPWASSTELLVRMIDFRPFLAGMEERPPELPLLTVRAARRAVAANPDAAATWLHLGEAYIALHNLTGERRREAWGPLETLRHIQATTALEHAVILEPDLEPAHRALTSLYGERMFLDAAVDHARETLRLTRRGAQRGEGPDEFAARLGQEEERLRKLEELVRDRRNDFAIRSRPLSGNPLARAQLALDMGLARVALEDVLLRSPVQLFGGDGARLELELLLMFGRAYQVRDMLDDEELRQSKHKLGASVPPAPPLPGYLPAYQLPAYEWLRFCQSAALGDYGPAAAVLEEMLLGLKEDQVLQLQQLHEGQALGLVSELGLAATPEPLFLRLLVHGTRERVSASLTDPALRSPGEDSSAPGPVGTSAPAFLARERADLSTLGGLLAVEQGNPVAAEALFRAAFEAGGRSSFASRPLAAAYRRRLEAASTQNGP
jgi:hypothetical protein